VLDRSPPDTDPVTDPAADHAAAEAVVGDFFRAMESWDHEALRATATADFELVEDTLIMTMDDFVSMIEPYAAQEAVMRWIESAVVLRQPDGGWKIDRLQSTSVSVEGALAEGG
jgi:hypothetical protein